MSTRRNRKRNTRNGQYLTTGLALGMLISALIGFAVNNMNKPLPAFGKAPVQKSACMTKGDYGC